MTREQAEKLFETWTDLLWPFVSSPEMDKILAELKKQKAEGISILPEQPLIFRCFKETPLDTLRFVVIGQDPYPSKGVPNGLAFSTNPGIETPKSLEIIYKAIAKDAGPSEQPRDNDLTYLCKQGGLLLNTALTVVEKKPNSHSDIWRPFTTFLVKRLSECTRGIIWFAWGKDAQIVAKDVDIFAGGHFVCAEEHPVAALYRGKNSGTEPVWEATCFSKANAIITANRLGEHIKW